MVFQCGAGYVLEACSSSSCDLFQKGRQAPGQRVFGSRSVFQWHGVSVWRRVRFGGLQQQQQLLCFEQDPEGTSSPGATCFWTSFRPSVAWCFGVAKGTFWRPAAPPPAAPPAAAGAAAAAGPAAKLALFLPETRRDVKPRDSMFLEVVPSFRAMVFCCFGIARWNFAMELF